MLARNAMMDSHAAGRPFNVSRYNDLMRVIGSRTNAMMALESSLSHVTSVLHVPEIRQLYMELIHCTKRIEEYKQRASTASNTPSAAATSVQSSLRPHQ